MIIDFPKPQDMPSLRQLWQEAFGDSEEFLDIFFATAMHPHRCFTAKDGNSLAGALYWFDCSCRGKKVAYLYAVATAKSFRGQGVCHRLMTHTHQYLTQLGYAGTLLVPGEESLFDFYANMGYSGFCPMEEIPYAAQGNALLRPLDKTEFGCLRRTFLPEGAVVQEGENLDFLAAQCNFYAGNGFVLAARKEDNTLTILELLGNPNQGIPTALDCTNATLRNFGKGKPYGMYRPLTDDPAPTYFAFSFD